MADTDRTRALHEQLEQQIAELVTSDDWAAMLQTAARFHHYSMGNVMLILAQRPAATRVAGYKTWQSMGRQVRRGERGLAILAPCVYRTKGADDGADDECDSATGRVVRGFKVAHVFDITQTDGDPVADVRPTLLDGEAPAGLWDGLAKLVAEAGFMLVRGVCGAANGVTSYTERTVTIRDDVSDGQACKTLAHELGHVMLHDGSEYATGCRGRAEVEAESVAYVVGAAFGMATDGYSLPYVARWADGDTRMVKATAERVIATAHRVVEQLERVGQVDEVAAVAA